MYSGMRIFCEAYIKTAYDKWKVKLSSVQVNKWMHISPYELDSRLKIDVIHKCNEQWYKDDVGLW